MSALIANFLAILAAVTALIGLAKTRPARWLLRRNVVEPVTEWARDVFRSEIADHHGAVIRRVELMEDRVSTIHTLATNTELSLNELKRSLGL